jgi:hypothetical protein
MRPNQIPRVLLLCTAAILLYSCSAPPRVVLDPDRVSPADLVSTVRANHIKKSTLQARGSISIETAEFANSGRFTMNLKHPDSLLINLRGPFGINVGTVFLSQTRFLFYNGMANQAIVGDPRSDILRSFLRMDVDASTVMDLFLGGNGLLFTERRFPDEFTVDGDQYLLIFRSAAETRRYWIDPALQVVTRAVYSDTNDRPVMEERFDRFTRTDGVTMARTVRVISHRERASLSFSYDRLDFNTTNLSFGYTIPRTAEIIEW